MRTCPPASIGCTEALPLSVTLGSTETFAKVDPVLLRKQEHWVARSSGCHSAGPKADRHSTRGRCQVLPRQGEDFSTTMNVDPAYCPRSKIPPGSTSAGRGDHNIPSPSHHVPVTREVTSPRQHPHRDETVCGRRPSPPASPAPQRTTDAHRRRAAPSAPLRPRGSPRPRRSAAASAHPA